MMGMPNPAGVRCQFPLALLFPPPLLVSSIERGASADFSALLFQRRRA